MDVGASWRQAKETEIRHQVCLVLSGVRLGRRSSCGHRLIHRGVRRRRFREGGLLGNGLRNGSRLLGNFHDLQELGLWATRAHWIGEGKSGKVGQRSVGIDRELWDNVARWIESRLVNREKDWLSTYRFREQEQEEGRATRPA
jgi:hypothetical protein